jgi:nucleotide-binding universal stress UspA family protein
MNFKDILVHIDNRSTCVSRLDMAVRLAKQQKARLTGIYLMAHPYPSSGKQAPAQLAEEARRDFERAAQAAGLESGWRCVDCVASGLEPSPALNLYAHYHDLLVVSQADPDEQDRSLTPRLTEKAVLGSGRPVLIVPYAGEFKILGKRVMLAWRGGPESSRALHDSLPLLRGAESIRVLSVLGRGGDEAYTAHDADICEHLRHYQLPVSCEKLNAGELSVGDMLLNRCADEGIDLLIMGAFSQTRRGHQTLGEVGSQLLQTMTVPVLMSH